MLAMVKIAVHGSYFGYNFGDTLLCRIFNTWIKQSGPEVRTVLPLANARNQLAIAADERGLAASLSADGFVFGGGGYFSEAVNGGFKWTARAWMRHLMLARAVRMAGKPLVVLGVGVGPVSNALLRQEIVDLLDYAEEVFVRDEESASALRDWGLKRDVRVFPDAVAVTDLKEMFSIRNAKKAEPLGRLVLHTSGHPSETELGALRQVCAWAQAQRDVEITLATDGMARRHSIDWPEKVAADHPQLRMKIRKYDGDVAALVEFLSNADGIVTTKLHVGIVGTNLGVPVISVPHHGKTARFYRQAGLPERVVEQSLPGWEATLGALLDQWRSGDMSQVKRRLSENPYVPVLEEFVARRSGI